jgi:hypothetical protein
MNAPDSSPGLSTRILLVGAVVGIAGGAMGFLAGTGSRPSAKPDATALPATLSEASSPIPSGDPDAPIESVDLPEARFDDQDGFDRYVQDLEAFGIEKDLAQWLALTEKARVDFDLAFTIAQSGEHLALWASGAALVDPVATGERLKSLPLEEARKIAGGFFSALGETDPEYGLALMHELPDPVTAQAAYGFFRSWASVSPTDASQAALDIESKHMSRTAMYFALSSWDEIDQASMLKWAEQQEPSWVLDTAQRAVVQHLSAQDPAAALDTLQRFGADGSMGMTWSLSRELARSGVDGWKEIAKLPEGSLRSQITSTYGRHLAQSDPEAALAIAEEMPPDDRDQFLGSAALELAKSDPGRIAEWLADNDSVSTNTIRQMVYGWSEEAPGDALKWVVENLDGTGLQESTSTVFRKWFQSDPNAAIKEFETLSPGQRAQSLSYVTNQFGTYSPKAALAWANGLDPLDHDRAVEGVFTGWSQTDPRAAAEAVLSTTETPSTNTLGQIVENLVAVDPTYAAEWVAQLPADKTSHTQSRMISAWAKRDAAGASDYLATLPPGSGRDAAIGGFVQQVANLDPAIAAEWAVTIESPDQRQRTLSRSLSTWRNADPDAALSFAKGIADPKLREAMVKVATPRK